MRILYHHRTLGDGAEGIHVREMVRAFRDLGHDVKVIGPAGEETPGRSRKSHILSTIKRSLPPTIYELLEIGYAGYSFWMSLMEIRRFKPDFIYDRYITFNVGTILAGKVGRVPVCLEVNAPLALERSGEQDERLIFRRLASSLERWICAHATQTLVVSTPLKSYMESIGVPHGKCVVMPNGVDPNRFSPRESDTRLREQLGIPQDRFIVGFSGVLRSWHGLDLLAEAVSSLARKGRSVFLLVVGDGPYRKTLESMVIDLNLGHYVCVTGRVPHDRVADYISLFNVAVSPRATFYASPMKVIEYMALGKPVVVPRKANFLDIIDEGVNGIAFEDGNAVALENALTTLYESPVQCVELGARAREKVERRLNWQWNAKTSCSLMERSPCP